MYWHGAAGSPKQPHSGPAPASASASFNLFIITTHHHALASTDTHTHHDHTCLFPTHHGLSPSLSAVEGRPTEPSGGDATTVKVINLKARLSALCSESDDRSDTIFWSQMVVLEGNGMLSSPGNQYLQPDYLSPLPTTVRF